MSVFNLLTLFGGLAMFLYGMRLMGDSLKESSSGALKVAMEHVTNNPIKAFVLGLIITAIIQSSTATIVITSGLVGAGILSLHQSLGIIVGANVGTTVTGQIIRLLDLNSSGGTSWLRLFQPSSLAPIALIIGIVLIMGGRFKSAKSVGNIAMGFGILFSGLLNMTGAVDVLAESGMVEHLFAGLGSNPFLGYATGAGVAFVLQSSSAAVGILQAFSQSGALTFQAVYPVIVGIYLGDCVTTAIVCYIGAKPEARRVGIVNILFNAGKSALVLVVVAILHQAGALDGLWTKVVTSGGIANTNTIFNLVCAIVLLPALGIFERMSCRIVKDLPTGEEPYRDKLEALSPVFFDTPALALNSCYDLLMMVYQKIRVSIDRAMDLLADFDETAYEAIMREEDQIDSVTDQISRYFVELLPHLGDKQHVAIMDQYYKVTGEFERLGDHAVNIADIAWHLSQDGTTFSSMAIQELKVLEEVIDQILDEAGLSFARRDIDAAYRIEPLVDVAEEIVDVLKGNHLKRMSSGVCNIYADVSFTNLLAELNRIAKVCSNVGVATVVRVRPELADHEHYYYSYLHSGNDVDFNKAYNEARSRYFDQLEAVELPLEVTAE